jgi:hypothetical protein
MEKISRKNFIKVGISAIAAFGLVNNPLKLIASDSTDDDWVMPEEARVSFASGEVFINNSRGDVGDIVREGDVVNTGDNSEAEIEIRDYAVFHIKENSTVLIEDILLSPRVEVKKGWFLAIIKRETQFEVGTPLVLAGVRGTVLFINVLNDEEAYLCDCNGKVDLEDSATGDVAQNIVSSYHKAFTLRKRGSGLDIERAKLLYHKDSDILQMDDRFNRETMVIRNKANKKRPASY